MLEWRRHNQNQLDIPHYTGMLKFIDLWAQASETVLHDDQRYLYQPAPSKVRQTYMASDNNCMECGTHKHPLYMCRKFRTLPYEQHAAIVRGKQLCYNCLKSRHIRLQCLSEHKCQQCRKPHHSLLNQYSDFTKAVGVDKGDQGKGKANTIAHYFGDWFPDPTIPFNAS